VGASGRLPGQPCSVSQPHDDGPKAEPDGAVGAAPKGEGDTPAPDAPPAPREASPATPTTAEEAIASFVRPLVEADGGGVELDAVEGSHVVVRLTRLCAGCPGAPYTIDGVIRPALESVFGDGLRLEVIRRPSLPGTR